ncbi:nuclease-related domain-containing protein [Methanobacterium formicicum]|uniref:NERD domain-containing protein n=1 Tax=Methanobacterium formicicum (strain DSM 3637 / PP1) TaxID=1204725 RepID=K2RUV5_METFP|nr:nuclease-related domain-containing protein [Methanobacterium formicicum]EKF86565.1 NERD domain-containing protein [Methanobacterium formicicum DSM 3637]
MSYLVCYKCDVYYEVETEEEIRGLTHCECGEKLYFFENLEDSYGDVDSEAIYEALSEVDDAFIDLEETSATKPGEINNGQGREKLANGKTYTQKKASQYEQIQDHGQLLTYAGVIIFIISFLALLTTLNFIYLISTLAGVLLSVYGNNLINKGKEEGYSWQKGNKGEIIVADCLDTLPEDYFVFNDVKLPGKGGNIDHIVIGPTGIYVIETKNYTGKYRIKGNQWFYYKNGHPTEIKKNPGTQVRKNTQDLINFLNQKDISTRGSWVTGLVALICPDFRVQETPQNYRVLLPKTVPEYIMNGKKETNTELLGKAAMALEPYSVELTFTRG